MLVMSALNNCPSYEHFVQILEHTRYSIDFNVVFQFVAKHYSDKYVEVFLLMQNIFDTQGINEIKQLEQNEQIKQLEQNEQMINVQEVQQKITINTLSTSQQYIQQYKNDPTMTQLGDDVESDEEHDIMTVRSGDKYVKVKVKRQT